MIWLALLATATVYIGSAFDDTIRNTNIDPMILTTDREAREAFALTLSGPQAPAVEVVIDGREILVWETCRAHLCASYHSVIAIDRKNAQQYSATYTDEGVFVLVDAPFGRTIDRFCRDTACQLKPKRVGRPSYGEPLLQRDLAGARGGANCIALNAKGETVLYTEGVGFIRHDGLLRRLVEDGIGGPDLVSEDHLDPIVIEIQERAGTMSRNDYELSERPVTIVIRARDGVTSIPATMRCES